MDKQEMLSEIQKIESRKVKYPSGNTAYDARQRLLFINDVLNFLDTAFANELYRVEKWKEKICQSKQTENPIFGYSWTQTEASYVLLKVKELLIQVNTIPSSELPTCRDKVSIPKPHENNDRQEPEHNTANKVEHTATTIEHVGMFLHAKNTFDFYDEIVTKLESEQIFSRRQLTPYETRLLAWAREEKDHAKHSGIEKWFQSRNTWSVKHCWGYRLESLL